VRKKILAVVLLVVTLAGAGLALWWPGRAEADELRGKVVGISDGDTATVLVAGAPVKVRLWGIDAPEKAQAFGQRSKQALSDLAFGKEIVVEVRGHDRYGRTLGLLRVGGLHVNHAMVRAGMAWWYQQYAPKALDLQAAELAARKAGVGLWRDVAPEAPWLFRRTQREARSAAPAP